MLYNSIVYDNMSCLTLYVMFSDIIMHIYIYICMYTRFLLFYTVLYYALLQNSILKYVMLYFNIL